MSPKSRENAGARPPAKAALAAARRRRKRGRGSSPGRARPQVRREGAPPLDRGHLDELTVNPVPVTRAGREVPSRRLLVPTRPLHIVMVGWEWPPSHTGGLGVHSFELCKELTKLGHRITFLTPFPGPFTPVPGVTFRFPGGPVGEAPSPFPPAYWAGGTPDSPFWNATDGYNTWIAELSGVEGVDVVHVHDWFGTDGAAALAHRLGRPLVMTVHSTEYDRSLGYPWQHILDREQRGISASARVVAVSRHLRQQLIERYHADPRKVRVIYNAVRPSERLAQIDPHRRVVLYVGRLAAMKGVDTFLRAAGRVVPQFPDVLFVIAGEGSEYSRLLHLTAALGIGDQVMFLGKVTDEEREILLAGSSVFVLPSVVEPFGIAALEAMAAGVPAIISKTSGVAEITSGAFRVDFWDVDEFASRIAELLEYPTLARAMGEQGRWESLREGWPERARETVSVYVESLRAGDSR